MRRIMLTGLLVVGCGELEERAAGAGEDTGTFGDWTDGGGSLDVGGGDGGTGGGGSGESGPFLQVSAGGLHACAIRADRTVVCWGKNDYGEATPPEGEFLQVSAGQYRTCGIGIDGSLGCWGYNLSIPDGEYVRVSVGTECVCALTVEEDGWCSCVTEMPNGPLLSVDAGVAIGCSVSGVDFAVRCGGYPASWSTGGEYVQVSAGDDYACAVRTDGAIVCDDMVVDDWDPPPAGGFVQVSLGNAHACALGPDGIVMCWGIDHDGETSPPDDDFARVSAGSGFTCGLRIDGTIACWGRNDEGQASPPTE